MSPLERSVSLSPLAGTSCSSLQERPRLPLAEGVCTCVCLCVWSLPSRQHRAPGMGAPSYPPGLPRSLRNPWVFRPHTIIPIVGGLPNFPVYLTQWGGGAVPLLQAQGSPRASPFTHPSTHPFAVPSCFSPEGRKGARPAEGGCRWLFPCHWPLAACFTRRVWSVFA